MFFVGHTLIFVFGVAWLSFFVGLKQAVLLGFIPFIPGEIIKTTMAAAVTPKLWKTIKAL